MYFKIFLRVSASHFSQLRYDALDLIASSLAKCVGLEDLALAPSSRLFEVLKLGLQEEKAGLFFTE